MDESQGVTAGPGSKTFSQNMMIQISEFLINHFFPISVSWTN